MPIQDWEDPATWAKDYQIHVDGVDVSYSRAAIPKLNIVGRAQGFIDALGLTASSVGLIDGGGYGWTAEVLKRLLPGIVANVNDPTQYIQDRTGTEALETILTIDTNNPLDRNQLALLTSRTMDWIITEEILNGNTNAENIIYLDNLVLLQGQYSTRPPRIAHYLTPLRGNTQQPEYNWKLMADWRIWLDRAGHTDDVLIESGNYKVF